MKTPRTPPISPSWPSARPSLRSAQLGLTLVEWMVSISIGLVLVAGLSLLFSQQSSTQAELEKSSRQIENGRYAMQLLHDDIQLAGYYGEYGADVTTSSASSPSVAPTLCAKDLVGPGNSSCFAIEGLDAPIASLPCSIRAANYISGTDILIVRHADARDNPSGVATSDIKARQMYIQTGTRNGVLSYVIASAIADGVKPASFDLVQRDGVTPGKIRKYVVHVYYLSPCSVMSNGSSCTSSDDGGTPIPTLRLLEPSGTDSGSVALVEGIENMQIDYGVDSYKLGLADATTPTLDAFKRHVFSQVVRAINVSARRDQ